jgi:hypothetical protein
MFDFCPHCGQTIGQQQVAGQLLVCLYCRKEIGVVAAPPEKVVIDEAEELIKKGTAARCAVCQQVIEVRAGGAGRALVPHFRKGEPRKMCPGSGKPAPAAVAAPGPAASPVPPRIMSSGKDLSAYTTRDVLKVVSCRSDAEPQIEALTLDYLNKADRVRIQIEALREILGPDFRMKAYPAELRRPDLAVWGNARQCVIGRKHPQGGCASLDDAEVLQVVEDLRGQRAAFFRA